jgi:hypothetical protein
LRPRTASPVRRMLRGFRPYRVLNSALNRRTLPNPGCKRDVGQLERGLAEEPLREQELLGLRELDGRHAELGLRDAAQVTVADAERCGEIADPRIRYRVLLDARDRRAGEPARRVDARKSRRPLRPAAQARAVARALRGGGTREKSHVLALRRPDRTDRPAIDAGRGHRREEAPVEAPITGPHCTKTSFCVEQHGARLAACGGEYSPFSDMDKSGGFRLGG